MAAHLEKERAVNHDSHRAGVHQNKQTNKHKSCDNANFLLVKSEKGATDNNNNVDIPKMQNSFLHLLLMFL